jgi:hypothetical protein
MAARDEPGGGEGIPCRVRFRLFDRLRRAISWTGRSRRGRPANGAEGSRRMARLPCDRFLRVGAILLDFLFF